MSLTTSCPVCGGPLHPVAGRCKHCRTDVAALRDRAVARAGTLTPPAVGWPAPPAPRLAAAVAVAGAGAGGEMAWPSPAAAPLTSDTSGALARHWPFVVAVAAGIAIAISSAILVGRMDSSRADVPAPTPASLSPDTLPDPMPPPMPPAPDRGRALPGGGPGPLDPAPDAAPVPAPGRPAASPQAFATALAEALCARLDQCGVGGGPAEAMCAEMARQLGSADPDRFTDGHCIYDGAAADTCLAAIRGLPCDPGQDADLAQMLLAANELVECSRAYVCD
jgi:hypothetical protein